MFVIAIPDERKKADHRCPERVAIFDRDRYDDTNRDPGNNLGDERSLRLIEDRNEVLGHVATVQRHNGNPVENAPNKGDKHKVFEKLDRCIGP